LRKFHEGRDWKKTGGDADRCENKGVVKKGIQKMVKIKE
jgi:hypothetical protein